MYTISRCVSLLLVSTKESKAMNQEESKLKEAGYESLLVHREAVTRTMLMPAKASLYPQPLEILQAHGCSFRFLSDRTEMTVPPGTIQSEVWPRAQDERFKLIFPDGWHCHETLQRNGISVLRSSEFQGPQSESQKE